MVLGGGGAKAAAHLGAARALAEADIEPVRWIGTSMGAVMAAALASGRDLAGLIDQVVAIRRHDVLRTQWTALLRGIWAPALFPVAPLRRAIEALVPARRFDQLRTPCTVTAVDVDSGALVVYGADGDDGPLIDVLTAACALPPYFAPVAINGRRLHDGGIRAAVPIDQASNIACDAVVAIDTAPGFDRDTRPIETPPPLIAATDTAMGWLMAGTTELQRRLWDRSPGRPPLIWLRPVTERGAMFAAGRTARYVERGYQEMRRVLEGMA